MSRPRPFNSCINTLNDSGNPGSALKRAMLLAVLGADGKFDIFQLNRRLAQLGNAFLKLINFFIQRHDQSLAHSGISVVP